jgi:hypothetical protein
MTNKPFLALVIPAPEGMHVPPGQAPGGPPGQAPGGPPGQQRPEVTPPIYIEPPELPDLPDMPEGSKLVLVWDGETWQWRFISGAQVSQPPKPSPKR